MFSDNCLSDDVVTDSDDTNADDDCLFELLNFQDRNACDDGVKNNDCLCSPPIDTQKEGFDDINCFLDELDCGTNSECEDLLYPQLNHNIDEVNDEFNSNVSGICNEENNSENSCGEIAFDLNTSQISDSELNSLSLDMPNTCSDENGQDDLQYSTMNLNSLRETKCYLDETLTECLTHIRYINAKIELLQEELTKLLQEENKKDIEICPDIPKNSCDDMRNNYSRNACLSSGSRRIRSRNVDNCRRSIKHNCPMQNMCPKLADNFMKCNKDDENVCRENIEGLKERNHSDCQTGCKRKREDSLCKRKTRCKTNMCRKNISNSNDCNGFVPL